MRSHVGGHILRNEIGTSRICGFCSKDAYETRMKSSRKGTKTFILVESSDFSFYFDYGRSKAFSKKKNPSINRIVACSVKGCKSLTLYGPRQDFIGSLKFQYFFWVPYISNVG